MTMDLIDLFTFKIFFQSIFNCSYSSLDPITKHRYGNEYSQIETRWILLY
jgi:hypothetical protein